MSCLIASLIIPNELPDCVLHHANELPDCVLHHANELPDCVPHHANELPDCAPHQVQKLIELESCKGRGVEVSARKD